MEKMFGLEMFAISHINGQFGNGDIYLIILNKIYSKMYFYSVDFHDFLSHVIWMIHVEKLKDIKFSRKK